MAARNFVLGAVLKSRKSKSTHDDDAHLFRTDVCNRVEPQPVQCARPIERAGGGERGPVARLYRVDDARRCLGLCDRLRPQSSHRARHRQLQINVRNCSRLRSNFTSIRAGWSLGIRCGRETIIVADKNLVEAERRASRREAELRTRRVSGVPACVRVVTIDPTGWSIGPYLATRLAETP